MADAPVDLHPSHPAWSTWPLAVLCAAAIAHRYVLQAGKPTSWPFFAQAAEGLLHRPGAGLDLYAVHPEFQFGPLAAVVAMVFLPLPHLLLRPAVVVFGALLGLLSVVLIERFVLELHPGIDPRRGPGRTVWWAAVPVLVAWGDVAVRNEHIDDAIALFGISAATFFLARRRPWVATALLAVAVAAKPWAIVCVPMLAAGADRERFVRPLVAAGAAGATWLPFVIADPHTLKALSRFTIRNSPTSGLRVLGVSVARTPSWDRPAQVLLGLAVAVVLVRLGRWWAVPMSALGIRLLLDPGTHRYYTAGLAVAVMIWELGIAPRRIPWRTIATVVVLQATASSVTLGAGASRLRFAVIALLIAFPLWEGWRTRPTPPTAALASPLLTGAGPSPPNEGSP